MRTAAILMLAMTNITINTSRANAEQVVVEIITEIREVSPLSFQVGVKSHQTILLDKSTNTATAKVTTGTTSIAGYEFDSIRNHFSIGEAQFTGNLISVTAKGQTASAVGIMPDIDYQLTVRLNHLQSKAWISGCHNEYPSYRILINGNAVYDREQTGAALTGLYGSCDILVVEDGASY